MRQFLVVIVCVILGLVVAGGVVYWWSGTRQEGDTPFQNPLVKHAEPEKPLLAYTIAALKQREMQASPLQLGEILETKPEFTAYQFKFQTTGKTMTGRLTIPTNVDKASQSGVIVMVRGYVPAENYVSGAGTNPASRVLAKQGFTTVAPDFLGYGGSDSEMEDEWAARFSKPVQVIELIKSLEQYGIPTTDHSTSTIDPSKLGIWAHSNGGQIALTALEIMGEAIPTTLWAPVTAPFPYSILYFGDEEADEGKQQRAWIALFEKNYDVADFSFTQHLDLLQGPLQLHQGLQDEAIHFTWSDEFVDKIKAENKRRATVVAQLSQTPTPTSQATNSARLSVTPQPSPTPITTPLNPIDITYYQYPGTNHNMQPSWETVMQRDLEFFQQQLQ